MAVLDAHQRTVRDGIKPEEVNYLLNSARMVRQTRAADGLVGYAGESGVVMAPHIANNRSEWERQTASVEFIGKILDHGPDGQDDYDDERYWVQELFEASPNGSTIHDPLTLNNAALIRSEYPVRYVTATNLAEIPETTHDAPTDGTIIVQVFMLISPDGAAKFYFARGGGGGGGLPVLVRPDNQAMFDDYFEASILDAFGARTDRRVNVAKPFDLRRSPFDGATILWSPNFSVSYAYLDPPTVRIATRIESGDSFSEIVWKPYGAIRYIVGGPSFFTYPLWALKVGEAITGVPGIDWLDLNVDSRIWTEL